MKAANIIALRGLKRFTLLALAVGLATSCATNSHRTNPSGDLANFNEANEQDKKDQDQATRQARFIKSSYNRW